VKSCINLNKCFQTVKAQRSAVLRCADFLLSITTSQVLFIHACVLTERDYVTFGCLLSQIRLSVVCKDCNVFIFIRIREFDSANKQSSTLRVPGEAPEELLALTATNGDGYAPARGLHLMMIMMMMISEADVPVPMVQ